MQEWQGWSSEREQVERTRILARLLEGSDPAGSTTETIDQIAAALGVSVQPSLYAFAGELDFTYRLVVTTAVNGGGRNKQLLRLNANGVQMAQHFRRMNTPMQRALGARQAVLRWLYERDHGAPDRMILDPHSWFFGHRFMPYALDEATANLADRGLLKAQIADDGHVMDARIVRLGRTCVEVHDANPDQSEKPMRAGTINNFHGPVNQNGANNSVGSSGSVTQTFTSVITSGQSVLELAEAVVAMRGMGWIPAEYQQEASQAEAELRAAAADESVDPGLALYRFKALIGAVNQVCGNPFVSTILQVMATSTKVVIGMHAS
jgi:hypothetical protein